MAIQNYILIVESALLLALSFYVLLRNSSNPINQSFALFTFGACIWVGTNFDWKATNDLFTRLTFLGAIIIAIGFYLFANYFPYRISKLSYIYRSVIIGVGVVLVLLLFMTKYFIGKVDLINNTVEYGLVYHVFAIYFLILWIMSISQLYKKFRKSDGIHRWQIKNLFYAISFSLIAGITTNLMLPWIFGIKNYGWVGPLFSILLFGFSAYILFKREVS